MNTTTRFWALVRKGDECWVWTGARNAGYGIFGVGGRAVRAHRLSWEMAHGRIPRGLFVCHHCDNPPCVRPEHLFLGTAADNNNDKLAKGRARCGTEPGRPLTLNGVTRPAEEWAAQLGMEWHTLYRRLARGWSVERALTEPVAQRWHAWTRPGSDGPMRARAAKPERPEAK